MDTTDLKNKHTKLINELAFRRVELFDAKTRTAIEATIARELAEAANPEDFYITALPIAIENALDCAFDFLIGINTDYGVDDIDVAGVYCYVLSCTLEENNVKIN